MHIVRFNLEKNWESYIETNTFFFFLISNLSFVLLSVVICLLSVEFGIFPHIQNGFYCNDPTISFKPNGEIISTMVILLSVFVPFFILWITEALFYKCVSLKSTRTRKSFSEAMYWFKKYFIGMIMHLLVVEVLKVTNIILLTFFFVVIFVICFFW